MALSLATPTVQTVVFAMLAATWWPGGLNVPGGLWFSGRVLSCVGPVRRLLTCRSRDFRAASGYSVFGRSVAWTV
ncbi:hypothetical protein GGR58DRAFT_478269 [Xylaria digitata]|nr:hypothetical protein GGR58DRAFT_478269 [Xylaria digitata]